MTFLFFFFFFFFNDTATTEIYTLSLHDALPICPRRPRLVTRLPPRVRAGPPRRGLDPRDAAGASGGRMPPGARLGSRPHGERRPGSGRDHPARLPPPRSALAGSRLPGRTPPHRPRRVGGAALRARPLAPARAHP